MCCVRFSDQIVPGADGHLRNDDHRSPAEPVFQDFQQTQTAGGIEGFQAQIIQDKQALLLQAFQLLQIAAIGSGQLQLLEQFRARVVAGLEPVQTGLLAQSLGDE